MNESMIIIDEKNITCESIKEAVISDQIEQVEYFMDREAFNPDELIQYAPSPYMKAFLEKYGADPLPSPTKSWLSVFYSCFGSSIYY